MILGEGIMWFKINVGLNFGFLVFRDVGLMSEGGLGWEVRLDRWDGIRLEGIRILNIRDGICGEFYGEWDERVGGYGEILKRVWVGKWCNDWYYLYYIV